ncbi:MAG: hypothetical protein GY870_21295 [archaeon]|nr:hypothetical protein [archaeon]
MNNKSRKTYAAIFAIIMCSALFSVLLVVYIDNNQGNSDLNSESYNYGLNYGIQFKETLQLESEEYWKIVSESGYKRSDVMKIIDAQVNVMENEAPHILEELQGIADGAEISNEDILALNLVQDRYNPNLLLDKKECTSFLAVGSATADGETLHHKNCDSTVATQVVVDMPSTSETYAYKAAQTTSASLRSGINEYGVSITNNYVFVVQFNPWGVATNTMNRRVLERSKNVEEAYNYLKTHARQEGAIFIVSNSTMGAIIEATPLGISSWEDSIIENGVGCRSNYFQVLGGSSGTGENRDRYENGMAFLTAREGSLTALDFNELSRFHIDGSQHSGGDGSICKSSTVFGTTFQINKDYPGILSTMWTAMRVPCSSIYTPIHIGSNDILNDYENGAAWNLANGLYECGLYTTGELTPDLLDYESQLMIDNHNAIVDAKTLLDASDETGAKSLLTNFDTTTGELVLEEILDLQTDEEEFKCYVSSISMRYTRRTWFIWFYGYNVYTEITVLNGVGAPLSGVAVTINLQTSSGGVVTLTGTTTSNGKVEIKYQGNKVKGTYTATVTNLVKSDYPYHPEMNIETTESIVIT